MSVVIGEVVSEVVVGGGAPPAPAAPAGPGEPDAALVERVVRAATERVVELLRREWEG